MALRNFGIPIPTSTIFAAFRSRLRPSSGIQWEAKNMPRWGNALPPFTGHSSPTIFVTLILNLITTEPGTLLLLTNYCRILWAEWGLNVRPSASEPNLTRYSNTSCNIFFLRPWWQFFCLSVTRLGIWEWVEWGCPLIIFCVLVIPSTLFAI